MARTSSTTLPLGTQAPDFSLPDVVPGQSVSLKDATGPHGLLAMFLCTHCPFVQHVNQELARLGRDYARRGLGIVAISSNDADAYPDDAPDGLRTQAEQYGFTFPYLHDENQETAALYAACTPDFFLFNGGKKRVDRGQFNSSRSGNNIPVDGRDVRNALDRLLTGKPILCGADAQHWMQH